MSKTAFETDTQPLLDSGDHDRFAHFVEKNLATESMVNGTPVVALCGKVWVPFRNPDKYKICSTCKQVYDEIRGNDARN